MGSAIALCILGGALVAPVAADAAIAPPGKLKTRTFSGSSSAYGPVRGTATCPKDTRVVSGGFLQQRSMNDFVVNAISKRSGRRTWTFVGNRQDFDPPGPELDFTVYAYCRKLSSKLKVRTASGLIEFPTGPGPSNRSVTATCPKGTSAISGGFNVGDPDYSLGRVSFYGSRRTGKRSWTVDAVPIAFMAMQAHTIVSEVYCLKTPVKPLTAAKPMPVTENSISATTPACAEPLAAAAGGFLTSVPVSGGFLGSVLSSRRVGRTWKTTALNRGDEPGTLRSFAYCS